MKNFLVMTLLLASVSLPHHALAQQANCGAGVDTGGGQCMPMDAPGMPGYQGDRNQNQQPAQPQQPRAIWEKRWGAIVIDNDTGQAGTVTNYASRLEAIDAATHDCQVHGSAHCKLELAYYNQCAAIAWGSTAHFTGGGPTKQNAESFALQSCNQGTTSCKIAYSDCSLPVRIK
jgi:hypothetical protein